jgi:transposase
VVARGALPPAATTTLRRLAHIVEILHVEAVAADAAVHARARDDAIAVAFGSAGGDWLRARADHPRGIGDIERFARGPRLACYAGLVSRVEGSAGHLYYGRITRQGSPWLRWALVEAALHAMKRQDALGRWARRLAIRKGGAKARVALARRLCDEV